MKKWLRLSDVIKLRLNTFLKTLCKTHFPSPYIVECGFYKSSINNTLESRLDLVKLLGSIPLTV